MFTAEHFFLALLLASAAAADDGDWPHYLGPHYDGVQASGRLDCDAFGLALDCWVAEQPLVRRTAGRIMERAITRGLVTHPSYRDVRRREEIRTPHPERVRCGQCHGEQSTEAFVKSGHARAALSC